MASRKFCPKWWAVLVTCFGLIILSSLGFWQLRRADEKTKLLDSYAQLQHQAPLELSKVTKNQEILAYQPLKVGGVYVNDQQFILDNRYYQHQFGYEIITPLLLANGKILLVNRGWVKAAANRDILPEIKEQALQQQLKGTVYYPSAKVIVYGNSLETKVGWPKRIEKVDFSMIQKLLGRNLYPFVLRLDKSAPDGFVRDWHVVILKPSRHLGYAFQWFMMAVAVLLIFIIVNVKREDNE